MRLREAVRLSVGHLALDGRVDRGHQVAGRLQSGHLRLPVAPQREEGLGVLPGYFTCCILLGLLVAILYFGWKFMFKGEFSAQDGISATVLKELLFGQESRID